MNGVCVCVRESEWLLSNAKWAIYISIKSWREEVKFRGDDDDVRFVPDQHA
jgi:hypothetical protein